MHSFEAIAHQLAGQVRPERTLGPAPTHKLQALSAFVQPFGAAPNVLHAASPLISCKGGSCGSHASVPGTSSCASTAPASSSLLLLKLGCGNCASAGRIRLSLGLSLELFSDGSRLSHHQAHRKAIAATCLTLSCLRVKLCDAGCEVGFPCKFGGLNAKPTNQAQCSSICFSFQKAGDYVTRKAICISCVVRGMRAQHLPRPSPHS